MPLIFSFMAIGTFCIVAAIIEAFIGQSQSSDRRLKHKEQHRRYRQ